MGVVANKKQLAVTSLNYSGILLSPFEFYSEDSWKQEQQLSKCFRTLLTESVANFDPKTYKWGIGKIDKDLQKQRYSPLYQMDAGIVNGKLINAEKFKELWIKQFQRHVGIMKTPPSEEEKKNCMTFDLMCYHSILYFLYDKKNSDTADSLDPSKYKTFMKKFFSKSFLNEKEKIDRTLQAMKEQEVDIFLVQEVTEELIDSLDKNTFNVIRSQKGNSVVILRKQKFRKYHDVEKMKEVWPQKLKDQINWNQNTAICFVDNLVIISFHLSSKKQKNGPQVAILLDNIKMLRKIYPMCEFVIGGDANSFIDPKSIDKDWVIYPTLEKDITTMKKRTWLQPQVNKAEELAATCRDHLLTTLPQENSRIVTIKGSHSSKVQYIPNQQHPCDHFVVSANITILR